MHKDTMRFRKIPFEICAALLSALYLTFLVDTYTLNTVPKRVFVFCYFLVMCLTAVFLRRKLTKGKAQRKGALAAAGILTVLYQETSSGLLLSLAITAGTIAYHVVMRLVVGFTFHTVMRNRADYRKRWYQVSKREMAVYEKLKVKKWKRGMPTYDPTLFAAGVWFGEYPVFIITSVLAAACDMVFVIMQRYNRQRVMKLLKRQSAG